MELDVAGAYSGELHARGIAVTVKVLVQALPPYNKCTPFWKEWKITF